MTPPETDETKRYGLHTTNAALREALKLMAPSPSPTASLDWLERENEMLEHQLKIFQHCNSLFETEEGRKTALFILQFFHSIPLPAWAADQTATIVHWGPRASSTYQHPEEKALGKNFIDLIVVGPEKKQAREDLKSIISGQEGQEFFNLCKDKDRSGKQVYLVTCCFPVLDPRSRQIVQAEVSFDLSRLDALERNFEEMYRIHRASEDEERAKNQALKLKLIAAVIDDMKVVFDSEYDRLQRSMQINNEIISDSTKSEAIKKGQRAALQQNLLFEAELDNWRDGMATRIESAVTADDLLSLQREIKRKKWKKNV